MPSRFVPSRDRVAFRARSWISIGEVALVTALLSFVAVLAFGPHLSNGGFYADDWSTAAAYRHLPSPGYEGTLSWILQWSQGRPVQAVLWPVPFVLFGDSPQPHLGLALGIGIATALAFYGWLRTIGLERQHSGLIAAFLLVFPWADSLRLWPTASIVSLSLVFALVGAILATPGFSRRGARRSLRWVAAALLFGLSILTYEATGPLIVLFLAVLLYRQRAQARWIVGSMLFVAAVLAYAGSATTKGTAGVHQQIATMADMAKGAGLIYARAVAPFSMPDWVAILVVGAVLTSSFTVARRAEDPLLGAELKRWLSIATAALVATAAAYAAFVPAGYWSPLKTGLENRVNGAAALPLVVLVYATLMLAALLVCSRSAAWRRWAYALSAALSLAVIGGYVVSVRRDEAHWDRAAAEQLKIIQTLRAAAASLPANATVYLFGAPAEASPTVPVFYDMWDLNNAAILRVNPSIRAYPVFRGAVFTCRPASLLPLRLPTPGPSGSIAYESRPDPIWPHPQPFAAVPYGRVVFVSVTGRRVQQPTSQASCNRALRSSTPGPFKIPAHRGT